MSAPVIVPVNPDHLEEWRAQRRHGLGSSDTAALFGMDRFKSPMAVWLDKVEAIEQDDTPAMLWGRRLESVIADEFSVRHDVHLLEARRHVRAPLHAFLQANPDRLIDPHWPLGTELLPPRAEKALEVKTSRLDDEWDGDEPPDRVLIQVQHQLEVLDLELAHVAVLLHGRIYREFIVHRDAAIGELIVDQAVEFWKLVEDRTPPPVDGSPSTTDALKALYATWEPDSEVELGEDGANLLESLRGLKAQTKDLEGEMALVENDLRARLGHASVGLVDGERAITWKGHVRHDVDHQALAAAHPGIVAEFRRERSVRPLRLATPKKEKARS